MGEPGPGSTNQDVAENTFSLQESAFKRMRSSLADIDAMAHDPPVASEPLPCARKGTDTVASGQDMCSQDSEVTPPMPVDLLDGLSSARPQLEFPDTQVLSSQEDTQRVSEVDTDTQMPSSPPKLERSRQLDKCEVSPLSVGIQTSDFHEYPTVKNDNNTLSADMTVQLLECMVQHGEPFHIYEIRDEHIVLEVIAGLDRPHYLVTVPLSTLSARVRMPVP